MVFSHSGPGSVWSGRAWLRAPPLLWTIGSAWVTCSPHFGHPNSIFFVDFKTCIGGILLESMAQFYKRFPCRRWPQLEWRAWVCDKSGEGAFPRKHIKNSEGRAASSSRKIEQKWQPPRVTFCCCDKAPWPKAAYERMTLFWLMVSEGWSPWEPLWRGSRQLEQEAEGWLLQPHREQIHKLEIGRTINPQSLSPGMCFLWQDSIS